MVQRGSRGDAVVEEGTDALPLTTTNAIKRGKRLLAEAGKAHLAGDFEREFRFWSALLVLAAEQGREAWKRLPF